MNNRKTLVLAISIAVLVFSIARHLKHAGFLSSESYQKDFFVSRVIDGDTLELSNGQIVRYMGIDTPELKEKQDADWVYKPMPYSEEALKLNRGLVEGRAVSLEFDVQKRDRYNRLLAYVYVEGKMVNIEMVRQGYAMIYTFPPNVKYAGRFLEAQKEARKEKRGLWSDLEEGIIVPSEAMEHMGILRIVRAEIIDTYLSDAVLKLNCRDNFKIVIFRNSFSLFPKEAIRSPDSYFKNKTVHVWGIIKKYKGFTEIIVNDPSQLEILLQSRSLVRLDFSLSLVYTYIRNRVI